MNLFLKLKNGKSQKSILRRLLAINTSIIVIALIVISVLICVKEYISSVERQTNSLNSMAIIITDRLTGVMAFEDYDLARKSIASLKQNEDILTACLYDIRSNLVTRFNKHEGRENYCHQTGNITAPLMVDRSILLDDQPLGRLVLYADPKFLWQNLISMSVFLLFIATTCYFLSWFLSKQYFKKETDSLIKLAGAAKKISTTGDYKIRVSKGDDPAMEISNLVSSFNGLLDIVEKHSAELETMITVRTAQLNKEKLKVEKISDTKSEFLAKLSHDLRTPLTSIMGYTDLIVDNDTTDKKHLDYLKAIIRNTEFITELVNGLLLLAKLESTEQTLQVKPFDILQVLKILQQTFEPLVEQKQLMLKIEVVDIKENRLDGDSLKLHQILNNLLENAIKYTQQGTIVLNISQTAKDNDNVIVHIIVKDSGIGISDEKINSIFDDYIQLESESSILSGAGLGLAITKNLVDLMKGTIKAESDESTGSIFSIDIPFKISSRHLETDTLNENRSSDIGDFLSQISPIMTVDDDPNCRQIISKLIASQQPKAMVIQASSFRKALELFNESQPNLVFMDIELPDGTGFELAKRFRKINQHIIIIAISAFHSSDEYKISGDQTFDFFIAKPFRKMTILNTLSKLTQQFNKS